MGKLQTALKLLRRLDIDQLQQRTKVNARRWNLRRAGKKPFVYNRADIPAVCIPGNAESEEYFLAGNADRREIEILRRWIEPGDTFVDVGANLGMYAFAASTFVGDSGSVLAIEASLELDSLLKDCADMLGQRNVVFVQCAAGDADKDVDFYVAAPGHSTAEQSLSPDPARAREHEPIKVRMRTLATIAHERLQSRVPGAVKMDIEGAEPLALRAAPSSWFSDSGPLWIVEVNPLVLARGGYTASSVLEYFPARAFERWLLPHFGKSGERQLPVRRLTAAETFSDAWFYNLVAAPIGKSASRRRARIDSALT